MPKEDVDIGLKVHKSPIKGMTGVARINEEIYKDLEMDEKHQISVSNEKGQGIVVKVTADRLIERGSISLRDQDFDRLHVSEGDVVHIRVRKTIGETMKQAEQKVISKEKEIEGKIARKREIEREEEYERKRDLESGRGV